MTLIFSHTNHGKSGNSFARKALRRVRIFHMRRCTVEKHVGFPHGRMVVHMWIFSTLSTWFSTKKSAILLEKARICGKLFVAIRHVDKFSTYGANVEKGMAFVENLWEVCEIPLSTCGRIVTSVTRKRKTFSRCTKRSSAQLKPACPLNGFGRTAERFRRSNNNHAFESILPEAY